MCGRYVAGWNKEEFERLFNVQPSIFHSFNIAPTQYAPIIRQGQQRETLNARWGLIPHWVKTPNDFKTNMFNARAETLQEKASFRRPLKRQRCLVPASGFYEWKGEKGSKQPHYIHGEGILAFAGLWDYWTDDNDEMTSYTIITTSPNEVMAEIHNRMPVILSPDAFEVWLEPDSQPDELMPLLRPFAGELDAYPVDKRVGRTSEDDPALIEPLS